MLKHMAGADLVYRVIRIIKRIDLAAYRPVNRNEAGEVNPPGSQVEPQWLLDNKATVSH